MPMVAVTLKTYFEITAKGITYYAIPVQRNSKEFFDLAKVFSFNFDEAGTSEVQCERGLVTPEQTAIFTTNRLPGV